MLIFRDRERREEMRRKKTFVALVAGLLVLGFVSVSFGTPAFYTCRIAHVGSTTTRPTIQLMSSDGTVDYGWYLIAGDKAKEMLATALTAFSLNKSVLCKFDRGVGGSLELIYMKAD